MAVDDLNGWRALPPPELPEWKSLRERLIAGRGPQEAAKIELALRSAEQALTMLAAMGLQYHLEPGPAEVEEWPRLLFHLDAAPEGRLVYNEFDARDLGADWHRTLADAKNARGMALQFNGRGGVRSKNLPAQLSDIDYATALINGKVADVAERERRINEFKSRNQP